MNEPQQPRLEREGWVDNLITLDPISFDGKDVYPPELLVAAEKEGWVENLITLDPIPLDGKDVYPPGFLTSLLMNPEEFQHRPPAQADG